LKKETVLEKRHTVSCKQRLRNICFSLSEPSVYPQMFYKSYQFIWGRKQKCNWPHNFGKCFLCDLSLQKSLSPE